MVAYIWHSVFGTFEAHRLYCEAVETNGKLCQRGGAGRSLLQIAHEVTTRRAFPPQAFAVKINTQSTADAHTPRNYFRV